MGQLNPLVEEPGVGACPLGLKHNEQDVERARGTKRNKRENWQSQMTESPVIYNGERSLFSLCDPKTLGHLSANIPISSEITFTQLFLKGYRANLKADDAP